MIKKLQQFGNSKGVIISSEILELMGVKGSEIDFHFDGQSVVISSIENTYPDLNKPQIFIHIEHVNIIKPP